jgi:hypothetical protein
MTFPHVLRASVVRVGALIVALMLLGITPSGQADRAVARRA